jgi:PAS domain S-box-containing protein
MSALDSNAQPKSRIELALVWLQRIILVFLLVVALVQRELAPALAVLIILGLHIAAYLVTPRIAWRAWRGWGITLVDVGLGALAFYLTGNVVGQGEILGFCLAGIVAARLSLWQALPLSGGIWLIFTWPLLYPWLGQGEPFPVRTLASLLIYLVLTYAVNYLVSIEFRQSRIARETATRLRQLVTVHEVGRTITSTLEMSTVLSLIMDKAVEILNAEAGSLLLLDDETDELVFRVVLGPAVEMLTGKRLPSGEGIAGQVLQTGEGLCINDVRADPHWHAAQDAVTGFETRSMLCVPLWSRGQGLGVLQIINKRDGSLFDREDLSLLSTFAAQASIALENARLYEKTDEALNRRLRELATIEEIDHELGTSLDYNRIINLVLARAIEACNASSGLIGILSPDGERLVDVRFYHGEEAEVVLDATPGDWPLDIGIIGRVVRSGQPALATDVSKDPDHRTILEATRSEIAVPIERENRVIGVLNLESDRPEAFAEGDLRFLEHLVEHAAIAIENARLFQEEQRRASDLATLNQVSAVVSSELDPDNVLKTIVDSAIQVTGCQKAAIFVIDHNRASLRMSVGLSDDYVAASQDIEVTPESRAQAILMDDPLLVTDIETDPQLADFVPLARKEGFRALADVPLRGREEVLGDFTVYYAEPHQFSAVELDTLKTFANQAAIALENARLFQAERQRVQMLSAVGEISREIRARLELEPTLNLILDRVKSLVDYYIAEICLWDEARQVMESRASAGDPRYAIESGGIYYRHEGYTGWIVRHQERLLIPDTTTRDDVRPKVLSEDTPVRSYVGLPLKTGDAFVGTLELASDQRGYYTEAQVEILQIFADQAAVAIQNARLFEAEQETVQELGILFETSAAISSSLELNEVLRTVGRKVAAALDVSSCSISDWNRDRDTIRTLIDEDMIPDSQPDDVGKVYSLDDYPATAAVLHDRTPRAIQASDPDADPAEVALLEKLGYKSMLMVPMVARDRVVGLLELFESRHPRVFSQNDIRLSQTLANQAAIAIENARLFERTDERLQARVDELTALQRTTQELNATLALDSILEVVLESAIQTTGATHGNVMLKDLDTGQFVLRAAQGYSEDERAAIEDTLLHLDKHSITLEVVESGEPRIVDDAGLEPHTVCVRADTRSALAVPVYYEGAIVGIIHLRHTRAGAFDHEDLNFLQALGEQAAVAIGNAMRFEDQVRVNVALRQRTEQMTGLLEVSQKLRADVPLEDTLEEIAYAIQETVGFGVVLVSIVEDLHSAIPMLCRAAAAGLPLDVFEEAKKVRQPLERYEQIFREEYRRGQCYFFPFQKWEDWATDLHTIVYMPEMEDWQEGQWHTYDMLLAPLQGAGGRLLGHISVDEPRDGQRPSRQTLEALAIYANQAAIAVENTNLYKDAQQRGDSLALLNKVSQTLTQTLDPTQVLNTVVAAVGDLLQCEQSVIFQPSPFDGKLVAAASYGVDLAQLRELSFAPGEGLVGQVAATALPLWIPDTEQEPYSVEGLIPAGSMMLVPIQAGRQLVGVLTAGYGQKHALTESEQVLLSTLSDQAAVALESARLFASTQQAAVRLSLLNEIGRRAASQLSLQEMLDTTVTALHQNLEYFRVAVFLVERHLDELYVAAANESFWTVIPSDYRQRIGEGLIGASAATRETVLVNDTASDERYFSIDAWDSPASLSVPIMVADQLIGVLHVEAEQPWAFTEEDAAALEIAADQLAVAIQNARLFDLTQRRVAELATITEIGRAISSALDTSELAELIYSQVGSLLDTHNFHIALYDPHKALIHVPFLVEQAKQQSPVTLRLGQGLTSYLIQSGEPILLNHGTEEFLQEHNLTLEREPAKSWLGVPMISEDRVIGAIAVQSFEQENAYDAGHLELLTTIAGQAAIAFQNAALFEEIVRFSSELEDRVEARTRDLAEAMVQLTTQRDRAETLYRITSELGTSLELERVLDRALQLFADAMGIEHGTIALLDQKTGELLPRATLEQDGRPTGRGEHASWNQIAGLAEWVVRNREPLLVPDVAQDERWLEHEGQLPRVRSMVAAPLSLGGGDILGAITLGHPQVGHFTKEHVRLVTAAASQVAIAVNNSDLYAFITDQAEQVGSMLQAQREEAAKSQAILESIADGVLVLDHNGRVLLINPAAEEMLGISAMVLQGEHFRHMLGLGETLTHRELAQELYTHLRQQLEASGGEQALVHPGAIRLEAGNRVLAVNIAPLVTAIDGIPGLVAALRDMSREAEVERLKNEFISTVSHELRTPMTSIKGYTDLLFLGMAGGLSDAQRNFLQIIKSNADRLTALVNDILDISRIETGRIRLAIEPLDLAEIVTQVVLAFQEQYRDKDLALEWEAPEQLPQVRGDAARVTQVLSNLIANAWQYTPCGGRVTVSIHEMPGLLRVDVADTGIGIAPDDIARVFDRFFRVDRPAVQEIEGTGLGLSIVKMFVEMLGGEIWLESELDVGTTFSFTLPLSSTELPEVAPELLTSEPAPVARPRRQILVVEDDRNLALLLRRRLEAEGYQVLLAGSGEDALWLAREEQPQLITLDMMLSDMEGFEVLERLKEHPLTAPIPVVMVMILGEADTGFTLGAMDYVIKPVDEEKLLHSIRRALARRDATAAGAKEGAIAGNLLVVDDDSDTRAFLDDTLSVHGYQVWTAASGSEAMERAKEIKPDLILLDLGMPGMDGYKVIRQLKDDKDTRPIPIIVTTASPLDLERDKIRVLGMGAAQSMTKPLSIESLSLEVKAALEERQAE